MTPASRRRVSILRRWVWLGCAIAAATLLARSAPAERDTGQVSDQMAGTVRSVRPEVGEVAVLMGVGHALRLRVFHAGPECAITVAGATARLPQVAPGAVVVVRYHRAQGRDEASSIAAQPPPRQGRGA